MKTYRVWIVYRGKVEAREIVEAENAEAAKTEFLKRHRYLVRGVFTVKAKEIKE